MSEIIYKAGRILFFFRAAGAETKIINVFIFIYSDLNNCFIYLKNS